MSATTDFRFDNTYARDLPDFAVRWQPAPAPAPRRLFLNRPLAQALGWPVADLEGEEGARLLCGNCLPPGAEPIAQAYAGHQFGGFSPQLGDGRALLLGEVIDREGRRVDIAFKGSGRTPFSRGGDGKAAVGPMLREVLIGEALHSLGIPTTRALAVVATGEEVWRDTPLPGAVLTRVAASHLRVGTFQYFAARGEHDRVRQLLDYAVARHAPELVGDPDRAFGLLQAVAARQAALVARWMNVGFIHGVMNTDNMTISGQSIDFGPCAFLEAYDPQAVFSSIDHQGRYAFGNQPYIARWNLARFAETLLPLMADDTERAIARATEVIDGFPALYRAALLRGQRDKLGLKAVDRRSAGARGADLADPTDPTDRTDRTDPTDGDADLDAVDAALADDWLALLHAQRVDFTLAWRRLADAAAGDEAPLASLFADPRLLQAWLARWRLRCAQDDGATPPPDTGALRAAAMRRVNPLVIPRHHRVEEALAAASADGDLAPFEQLLAALVRPFDEGASAARYAEPAPVEATARYRTFCGT